MELVMFLPLTLSLKKKPFLVFGPMEKREVQIWSVWTRKKGFAAS